MVLKLYNTLMRKKEEFKPLNKNLVLFYTCGPTVHDYAHIGNFRTFVFQDILKRWLVHHGYRVKHVMNITDVDEKTIERSERKKIPRSDITMKYEKAFFEDLDRLNITRADHYPRVTDNISAIAQMVGGLYQNGHAFRDEEGSYYYNINTFKDYGRLSGKTLHREIRAKISREDYKTPKNFLLWTACNKGVDGNCWNSSLGWGRPGWHIECAALAEKYLGETIDIHSGGVDLLFPHHENEIAEAEAYTGETFSRYWVHVEHLVVFGKKMSKSLGNFFTVRQVIRKGYRPMAMRLLYIKTHYRGQLDFDFENLEDCQNEVDRITGLVKCVDKITSYGDDDISDSIDDFKNRFNDFMDDDLQTDKAWKLFLSLLEKISGKLEKEEISKTGIETVKEVISLTMSVFGIGGVEDKHS